MQMEWDTHFKEIVVAAWQAYLSAERQLSNARANADEKMRNQAAFNAWREGGAACIYLHHFPEVLHHSRPDWLPSKFETPKQILNWASEHCLYLRGEMQSDDVTLLGDIANAFKHSILTDNTRNPRQITSTDQVLVVASGYGILKFGEGKFGGIEQILVQTKDGPRALTAILQNVIDAWRRVAGFDLPPIGHP